MRSPNSQNKKLSSSASEGSNASKRSSFVGLEFDYVNHIRTSSRNESVAQLDTYYGLVKRQLLRYQSPTSHLFPSHSSDTKHAHIRDSIYCSAAVWSLYLAYRRLDDDRGKSHELGQSAVASMRGILASWMRQAHKLEQWKISNCSKLALHTIVDLDYGEEVLSVEEHNHLQLDVVCLYLLYLVQMITSGLEIVYSMEEVAMVQNLVYYIERAYRTPDFGSWGRGTKYNDGSPEVSASAIGMAKAALEAVHGFNVFGERGSKHSVIYADIDAHNRNRSIFETLLPRESNTKNTDVSLLATISYPAFATQNEKLYSDTKSRIVQDLKGEYGFKRFSGDGYGTELEDLQRRYYQKGETLDFENVENEWPIFYIFMIIDGIFKDNQKQVEEYEELINLRMLYDKKSGDPLVPVMFSVPTNAMKEEKLDPKSQKRRITVHNILDVPEDVFLWGQAMFIMKELLIKNLLHIYELDPIKRFLPCYARQKPTIGRYSSFLGGTAASDLVIQVVMIAESTRLQCMLANYGIQAQTPTEVEPVQIWPPTHLVKVCESMGQNRRLKLNGRPNRPIGSLGTSKLYRVCGKTILCYPIIFSASEFYLSHDMALLTENIRDELKFISKCWRLAGRPTFCIMISEQDMRDPQFSVMLNFLADLAQGHCEGVKVRLGRLQNLQSNSCIEHLDFLPNDASLDIQPVQELKHLYAGYQSLTDIPKTVEINEDLADFASQYRHTGSGEILDILRSLSHVYGSIQLCGILLHREGPGFPIGEVSVKEKLELMHREAGHIRYWAALRYSSSLLEQMIDSISPYATQIIVNGKTLTVGTVGVVCQEFEKPCTPQEMHTALYTKVQPYNIIGAVLQQELLLYCGKIIATNPASFQGIWCLRMERFVAAIEMYQSFINPDQSCHIENLPPSKIRKILIEILELTSGEDKEQSVLPAYQVNTLNGCLIRVPSNFYPSVYLILQRCPGGLVFTDKHLPHLPTVKMMDPKELSFFHLVESLLAEYSVPHFVFLIIRALTILATVLTRNPELAFKEELRLENLIKDAFQLYLKDHDLKEADSDLSGFNENTDLKEFEKLDPAVRDSYFARAIVNLLLGAEIGKLGMECKLQ